MAGHVVGIDAAVFQGPPATPAARRAAADPSRRLRAARCRRTPGRTIVAPVRNPPRSWISLKPLRRDPAEQLADRPAAVGGKRAQRLTAVGQQLPVARRRCRCRRALRSPCRRSRPDRRQPRIVSSAIGIHPRGDVIDVVVEVEMSAVVPGKVERARGVAFPEPQFGGVDAVIAAGAQHGDVGADSDVGAAGVAVDRLLVGPHRGDQQFRELLVGEQFGICAAEIRRCRASRSSWLVGSSGMAATARRRRSRRRPQPLHRGAAGFGDPGELESDDSTHAVTEQPQRRHLTPGTGDEQAAGEILDGFGGRARSGGRHAADTARCTCRRRRPARSPACGSPPRPRRHAETPRWRRHALPRPDRAPA